MDQEKIKSDARDAINQSQKEYYLREQLKAIKKELDNYLAVIDGEEHDFYHQFNKIESLKNVVVLYDGSKAIGCGAFKKLQGLIPMKTVRDLQLIGAEGQYGLG